MNMAPRVSVIIPTYNRKDYVQEAIDSVLAQTYSDYEIIVVDDGSTDETSSELLRYGSNIKYYVQPNSGVAAARNLGIRQCDGEYVAFLDADDMFLPNHLAILSAILDRDEKRTVGWVGGNWRYINASGDLVSNKADPAHPPNLTIRGLLFSWPIQPSGVLVRRSWLEEVKGFDETLLRAEDCDLWLRLAQAGCIMSWTEETVCLIRLHEGQKSRHVLIHRDSVLAFVRRFFSRPDVDPEIKLLRDEVLAHHLFNYACREYYSGQIKVARQDISSAIILDPRWIDTNAARSIETIVGHAMSFRNDMEPIEAVETLFDNLPPEASELTNIRRRAIAQVTAARYFRAHKDGESGTIRRLFPLVAARKPSLLLNIGFLAIAARAWLKPAEGLRGQIG